MLDAVAFERPEAQVAAQRRGDGSPAGRRHAVEFLGDEAPQLIGGRRGRCGRPDQCIDDLQSPKTGASRQTPGLLHVLVVAVQRLFDRVDPMAVVSAIPAVAENDAQMPQRRSNLVAAAMRRGRAGAAWQVLIDEPADSVIEVVQGNAAADGPSREVREAAEVRPRRARRVAPLGQAAPIGRHERRQRTGAQPRRRPSGEGNRTHP